MRHSPALFTPPTRRAARAASLALLARLAHPTPLARLASLALLAASPLVACDDPYPPASQLQGVRVLAVQSDTPLARPGETVNLTMLVHDGGAPPGSPRPLQVAWFGGCDNPAGDSYESCFSRFDWLRALPPEALADGAPLPASLPPGAALGHGPAFSWRLADDLISTHRVAPGQASNQGLSFVFFAACSGRLVPATAASPRAGIPVECVDAVTGSPLSSDEFVSGYVTVRADARRRNLNPVAASFTVAGVTPSAAACADDAGCPAGEGCGAASVCLPVVARCVAGQVDDCPEIALSPALDPALFELDEDSALPGEAPPPESVWASYFATVGELEADSESVVDQSSGARSPGDYEGRWRVAPGFTGLARVFVVLRDGRGGTSWVAQDVLVR